MNTITENPLRSLVIPLLLLVALSPALVGADDNSRPLRRIVLISCDTLRADALSCYGNQGTTTTGLDSLASQGTMFLNCSTPMGWTLPAHMAIFTSLAPGAVRVGVEQALPAEVPLLTEILADNGFVCGAMIAENGWMAPKYGFNRGFRQYSDYFSMDPIESWTNKWEFRDDLTAEAPFFLFFHFMDTHSVPVAFENLLPYMTIRDVDRFYHGLKDPLPEKKIRDGKWDLAAYEPELLRKAYDSATFSLDFLHIRPLLSYLRDNGLAEDTMIIMTGDHGEELGEHGGREHDSPFNEVRHVPLLVVWPGVVPTSRVVYDQVNLMDIMPTVLDYAGLPAPELTQGMSLRPLLNEERGFFPARDLLVDGNRLGLGLESSAIIAWHDDALWSLVANTDTTGCAGSFHPAGVTEVLGLYNLDLDPEETDNLQQKFPEIVSSLTERMTEMLADEARLAEVLHSGVSAPIVPLNEEDRRKLKALGY